MKRFKSFDGVEIAYDVLGEGDAVVMHHGFASDSATNFVRPGVARAVADSGRQVVLVDARGHGQSGKPHDPASYAGGAMVRDARALLDHLGLDGVHFLGYSMGSFIGMSLAPAEPRVASLVLGGAGVAQIRSRAAGGVLRIAEALEVADPAEAVDERGRAFRNFADATKADRLALAASLRVDGSFPKLEDLATITVSTLVLNGLKDTMTGPPEDLAQLIPGARYQSVPGDHLSAVVQPEFRQAVVAFLDSL